MTDLERLHMKDPENFTAMENYRVKLQLPGFGHPNRDSSLVFQTRPAMATSVVSQETPHCWAKPAASVRGAQHGPAESEMYAIKIMWRKFHRKSNEDMFINLQFTSIYVYDSGAIMVIIPIHFYLSKLVGLRSRLSLLRPPGKAATGRTVMDQTVHRFIITVASR